MQGLELAGVGGILLLVLPVLSIVTVLLTAPVAKFVAKRRHEEAQVARAPMVVALAAISVEGVMAFALALRAELRAGMLLLFGPLALDVTPAAAAGIFSVSAFLFVLLVSIELSQARPAVMSLSELAAALGVWAVQSLVLLHGDVPTMMVGVWLIGVVVSLLLLIEAPKHYRVPRLWLVAWAILVPCGVLALLWPLRDWHFGADLVDTRALLRAAQGAPAATLSLRIWLSTSWAVLAGVLAFAAVPKVRTLTSPGPALIASAAVLSTFPSTARLTAAVLPPELDAAIHLGPTLRAFEVAFGIVLAGVTLLKLDTFRRLWLFCAAWTCGAGWAFAFPEAPMGLVAIASPIFAAFSIPFCFAAISALAASRVTSSLAPPWLPVAAIILFPLTAALGGPWVAAVTSGAPFPVQLPGLLLAAAIGIAAIWGVAAPLIADRRDAFAYGLFPRSQPSARRSRLVGDLVLLVVWLLLACLALAGWHAAL